MYKSGKELSTTMKILMCDSESRDDCINQSFLTRSDVPGGGSAKSWRYVYNINDHNENGHRVAVILGYYNGNRYLPEQIRSILEQSHNKLEVFVSDDCSPIKIDFDGLGLPAVAAQRVHLSVRSTNVGFTKNFLHALRRIDQEFEYFAFSDQDDVWHHDKITNALTILTQYQGNMPALYCARTAVTDEICQADLGSSPRFRKSPSFANALVQNIGGGNTMVFNKAARDLIVKSTENIDVVSHDWWCYQIVSGAGGVVHYDPRPCLKYRQHSENLVGSNNNRAARFIRIRALFKGKFRHWNDINFTALSQNKSLLSPENQCCLDDVIKARQANLFKRLFLFRRSGIYRQTFFGNLGLFLGIVINKI